MIKTPVATTVTVLLPLSFHAEVSVSNHAILAQFCKDHHVGLVVVGPEVPLAAGKLPPSYKLCCP